MSPFPVVKRIWKQIVYVEQMQQNKKMLSVWQGCSLQEKLLYVFAKEFLNSVAV